MSDNQFDKLFVYIMDMDKRISIEFAKVKADIRSLRDAPDIVAKRLDDETEHVVRDAQQNRLVEWAREVSKKTGVPLPDLQKVTPYPLHSFPQNATIIKI